MVERYSYTSAGLAIKKRLHPMNSTSWPSDAGGVISTTPFMEAVYTYNNAGQMVSVKYPADTHTSGPWRTYTYSFDTMGRPNKLTDNQATPLDWVKDVLYSPSGQMTQMKFTQNPNIYYTETRSYNARLQLTQIATTYTTTNLNMQYVYSPTQNNGQIIQAIDAVSGETIDYTYDSLNRLITAATTGPQWGLSFGYDGFGNRLSQTVTKGSGPASSLAISLANNRITTSGYSYDSNGNLTTMPYGAGSMTLTYDVENRVIQAVNSNGTEQYGYSPDNRRVYQKQPSGTQLIHFYGANGDRLRTYTYYGNGQFQVSKTNLHFAGRLILQNGQAAFVDRLGSDRRNTRYYPYGEEYTATGNDKDKFATYFRDSSTGLDYAMNRYYGSNLGRFLTPDPSERGSNLADPQTSNRYSYVANDPINRSDPSGLLFYNEPPCPPGPGYIGGYGAPTQGDWWPWRPCLGGDPGGGNRAGNGPWGGDDGGGGGYTSGGGGAGSADPTSPPRPPTREELMQNCLERKKKEIDLARDVYMSQAGARIGHGIGKTVTTGFLTGLLYGVSYPGVGLVTGVAGVVLGTALATNLAIVDETLKEVARQKYYLEIDYQRALDMSPIQCAVEVLGAAP
jgi:RHS repeat-associated protein